MLTPTPQELADLEDLAALAEGRLSAEERARVLARLEGDEEALDLFASLLTLQGQEEASSSESTTSHDALRPSDQGPVVPPGQVVPFRRRPVWWPVVAIAAAVALALGVVYLQAPAFPEAPELTADVRAALRGADDPSPVTRSANDEPKPLSSAEICQWGIYDLDFRSAITDRYAAGIESSLEDIEDWEAGLQDSWFLSVEYQNVARSADPREALADLDRKILPEVLGKEPVAPGGVLTGREQFQRARCLRAAWAAEKAGSTTFWSSTGAGTCRLYLKEFADLSSSNRLDSLWEALEDCTDSF